MHDTFLIHDASLSFNDNWSFGEGLNEGSKTPGNRNDIKKTLWSFTTNPTARDYINNLITSLFINIFFLIFKQQLIFFILNKSQPNYTKKKKENCHSRKNFANKHYENVMLMKFFPPPGKAYTMLSNKHQNFSSTLPKKKIKYEIKNSKTWKKSSIFIMKLHFLRYPTTNFSLIFVWWNIA